MCAQRAAFLGSGWVIVLALLLLLPGLAASQTAPVRPILECVIQQGPSQYTAVYGYKNENAVPITIPVGPSNKFTPTPQDRGQTTVFQPGRTPYGQGAFRVPFNGSNLVWTLKGPDGGTRTSTASANSKRCPGPTLTSLDPASLSLTQGGNGVLTATISAPQAAPTSITVQSSDPAVALVPSSVLVPAGSFTAPITIKALAPGTATITASLNGSSRQSTITVTPAGPMLTSLLPATLQVTQGALGTFTVTISAAQGSDTVVALSTSAPEVVGLPPGNSVTVPTGQLSQGFAVSGVSPGPGTVTATLSGSSVQSQVTVIPSPPTVAGLAPPVLPLTEGSGGTLTVTLNATQPTDTVVALATSDPSVVGLPGDQLIVPAHTLSAGFTITGLARGTATVTASLNGTSATAAVTVQPPPPTVSAFTCPATLAVGVAGQCALILNATQPIETLVPLTGDAPAVLTVPASVTVPAGTLTMMVAITALAPGMATITAGPLNETTRQATIQVLPPPPTLAGLTPSPTSLLVGASTTLILTLNAAQGTDTGVALATSPAGVVTAPTTITVPAGALSVPVPVSALSVGSAVLTAGPLNGSSVEATVTVTQLPPTVSSLRPPELMLPKGTADSLTVTIAPVQPDATTVPLTSSAPGTVEVPASVPVPAGSASAAFPVIGRNVGDATVTAGPLNGTTAEATVTVTPPALVTLTLTPSAVTLAVGQTQAFTATGTYTDGSTQDLTGTATWTSSNEAIATVTSPGGILTARAVGQATLTATLTSPTTVTASAPLTVTPPVLAVLALTPSLPTCAVGQTVQFTAMGTYSDGSTQNLTTAVTWASSTPSVATITSPGGLATALAAGTTTITATHADGLTAETTLTVMLPPPTITRFDPTSGKAGTSVTITGTFLGTTSSVAFNGTSASFTIQGPTMLTTVVPSAATSGPLTVTTSGGSATTPGHFLVLPTQDLSLIVEPSTVTAIAGTSVSLRVRTVASGGFSGLTPLNTGPLPDGVTASFAPQSLGPNAAGLLTLTTSGSTPSNNPIEVRGSVTLEGVPVTRSATATLLVQPPGPTLLTGRILDEFGQPVPGVTIRLGGPAPQALGTTDAAGNFLVSISVAGSQVILVDGTTANTGSATYAVIPITVTLQPGMVNSLGYTPYLHVQPRTQPLPVAPTAATPITFPDLPGFQLTIPAGVRIIGWDGQPNTRIGARLVPLDRLPLPPLPPGARTNAVYMFTFGKYGGGTPTQPIPVTAPNTVGAYPGQQVELWYYNEAPDGSAPNTWEMFGYGTVSSDGRLIVSNAAVGIPRFCCGGFYVNLPVPPDNTPPDETAPDPCPDPGGGGCQGGDPVELSSGVFLYQWTDLTLPGRVPILLTRIYRTNDSTLGLFGIGTRSSYDAYLRQKSADLVILFLPGNYKSRWSRQPDGSFTVGDKPSFLGARLTKNADATWTLRYKDGRRWRFSSSGWLIAQQDRNGNTLTLLRDTQDRLTLLREPGGREVTLSYSGTDLKVTSIQDPLGRQVRYQYDTNNRLTQVSDPAGGTWEYTYDGNHRMLSVTNPRGILQTQNTYDGGGRVATQTLADGSVTRFGYTVVAGTVVAAQLTEPTGASRRYRFAEGYPVEAVDGLGQPTIMLRAPGTNLLQATTDPLGRTTRYTHDAAGNILAIIDPLNQTRSFTYDPTFNQVLTSTDPLTQTMTYTYDTDGNLTAITDPLGHATTFTYNPLGQPLTATDALGHSTSLKYDSLGNLTATVDPLGHRTERTYDTLSRVVALKDPKGTITRFSYDTLDRLLAVADPLNGVTRFSYGPNGNLLTVTDAKNQTTTHTYDPMDRLEARTDPLGRMERFAYDLNGNLKTFVDRKGQTTTHTYDTSNRRIRTEYTDGSSVSFTYDAVGNRLTATDSLTGTLTFTYDALNRRTAESVSGGTSGTITYSYDPASRRQAMQVSGLQPVAYSYDANSRLTGINQGAQSAALQYDPANRRTSLVLPNGITVTYQYDEASRLIAQTYTGPQGVLGDLTYSYDPNGNRIATGGSWSRSGLPGTIASSAYDVANQQLLFGGVAQTFDANGNLLTQTDASGTTNYSWDARNRLLAITGPSASASFAYDALGRRISKTITGVTTTFLYDGLDIVGESGGGGDVSYLRTLEVDEGLTKSDDAGTSVYLADTLGSTTALTDSSGAPVTIYTYAPFGETSVSGFPSTSSYQFSGRENDSTGLYYYRARYYDPVRSRFLSQDPIGFSGGDWNLYTLVGNSPLNFVDPSGLDFRPGPRGYGGPWKPSGIPHYHPILPGGDGGALVNPNDPGRWPGTTHDRNPLEGNVCIKCNWTIVGRCVATPPTPNNIWSCIMCDQVKMQNPHIPWTYIPACAQCYGTIAAKYGQCLTKACEIGRTDNCGRCK